ncbi:hypothetical protein ACFU5Y_02540 [Streptomyces gardneri]|uniref:hypothetical protein n=1 Tax=Streptomyces gardneri TaxID=66892 RepID=UPI0036A19758
MTAERVVRWVVAAAASVTVAGCGEEPGICTLTDADSQASVVWDVPQFPAGALYRLCVDQVCRDATRVDRDAPFGTISVFLPEATGEQRVTVRFRVADPVDGRPVYDRSARVTLRKSTPNGERCGPTVWQAGLRADPERGLLDAR